MESELEDPQPEDSGCAINASLLTPCRNNPSALLDTLESICEQQNDAGFWNEVIVIDGSEGNDCLTVCEQLRATLSERRWKLHRIQQPARGIYDALNRGLECASGCWIQVMPASDRYWDSQSLQRLCSHAEGLRDAGGCAPAAVFGQAWVEVPGHPLGWLTPDPGVRSIETWLRWMVPCHQAMLFDAGWARAHPYRADSHLYGDRPVMRAALRVSGRQAYLPEPVCRFRLGGVSSGLPDLGELQRRLSDPCLEHRGRMVELIKAALRRVVPARSYPQLMRLRAAWLGWRC